MMRGMYSAISGLRNHQIMLDVTANDLANVNTVGFKASRTSFRDSLAQMQRSGASATTGSAGAKSAQIGLGVQLGSIDNLMTNGAFQSTGSPYDVAITGSGWFRVSSSTPTPGTGGAPDTFGSGSAFEYTRAGNFTLSD
jgi:flagellar hook protein FlgE